MFVVPDWIDAEIWADFEKSRRLMRKPLTDTARKRIIKKLEDARSYCDPNECLGETVEKSWLSVFPKKPLEVVKPKEEAEILPGPWAKRL